MKSRGREPGRGQRRAAPLLRPVCMHMGPAHVYNAAYQGQADNSRNNKGTNNGRAPACRRRLNTCREQKRGLHWVDGASLFIIKHRKGRGGAISALVSAGPESYRSIKTGLPQGPLSSSEDTPEGGCRAIRHALAAEGRHPMGLRGHRISGPSPGSGVIGWRPSPSTPNALFSVPRARGGEGGGGGSIHSLTRSNSITCAFGWLSEGP